jgi:hypothetical protein
MYLRQDKGRWVWYTGIKEERRNLQGGRNASLIGTPLFRFHFDGMGQVSSRNHRRSSLISSAIPLGMGLRFAIRLIIARTVAPPTNM